MISACESEEYVPFGRQYCAQHPGRHTTQQQPFAAVAAGPHALSGQPSIPLIKALDHISIHDTVKKDSWRLRPCPDSDGCDEELYVNESTVVWSRGKTNSANTIIKSFTMHSQVQEALWCTFLLPIDLKPPSPTHLTKVGDESQPFLVQRGVCIVEENSISVMNIDGQKFETALPFPVAKTWPIKSGLLFERALTEPGRDDSQTPKKIQQLPVLFSMLHPLEEVAPVICRTGGTSVSSKVSYVMESSQSIVFSWEEPSLVLMYDKLVGLHSVWNVRRSQPEEANLVTSASNTLDPFAFPSACSMARETPNATPGMSQSGSAFSRLALSGQSPSLSPLRNYSTRVNSPTGPLSRANSPSLSKIVTFSRPQSPCGTSFQKSHTPSPQYKCSPISFARTPLSVNASFSEQTYEESTEPLLPEICIDHLWTEHAQQPGISRDGSIGMASKAFLSSDLSGQQMLCYLVTYRHQLRCVKFETSNDDTQLIFKTMTILPARDAAPLESLKMLVILDMQFHLVLYSGTTKMNQIHVAGLPSPQNFVSSGHGYNFPPTLHFGGLSSSGPVTSSRPPSAMDARFDDDVELSPVRTEPDDSQMLDASLVEDSSFQVPTPAATSVTSIRDGVSNRFSIELIDGSIHRTSLPAMTNSTVVELCLEALKFVLPQQVALQLLIRWYCSRNAPGSTNGQSEWIQFVKCLFSLLGYDISKLPLTQQMDVDTSLSPVVARKKAKPSDQGTDEDWDYLLSSSHHQLTVQTQSHILGLDGVPITSLSASSSSEAPELSAGVDTSAPLHSHMASVLFTLHLVYEELKLDSLFVQDTQLLGALLCQLARDLECELYVSHYCRDHPCLVYIAKSPGNLTPKILEQLQFPIFMTPQPPSIFGYLLDLLEGRHNAPFPILSRASQRTKCVIVLYVSLLVGEDDILGDTTWKKYLHRISTAGHRAPNESTLPLETTVELTHCKNRYERAVLCMVRLGKSVSDRLVFGVACPLKEAIYRCRRNPPSTWPHEAFVLIGREDLAQQTSPSNSPSQMMPRKDSISQSRFCSKEEEDGMEYMDKQPVNPLKMRFSDDLRVQEVRRLLQSSRPIKLALVQRPEVSDHDFIEEQERHLYAMCIRTMALPVGRGMFTMFTYHPVPTEALPIPKLCLTGRAPPRNTTVDLTHIDTPANMSAWPHFHNGVAAGLRIADTSQVNSTWILYNKPRTTELTNEHGGFLMGLGLNGQLSSLATLDKHDYLQKGHEMTSVGLLLGVAAGKRGTMDMATTRLLSIHLAALLPPTSTELDVTHTVQVAAVLGVGLVYQGTADRHMAEVLLSEIGRPPGPEMENCQDRESYSLASGLALGMVVLGHGKEAVGLSDLNMADHLYHYMVGGHKKPLTGINRERYRSPSCQIKEGDAVNVNITAPGATLALGMMFFKTKNTAVAEWLKAPDTQFLLDFVRPDFLMLRTIARGLVMWDDIYPSEEWIRSNIPEIVRTYAFRETMLRDSDIDFETMSQAYCNLGAGACMALALKFAGSANQPAFHCLMRQIRHILDLMPRPTFVEQAGRSTVENCLCVIVLSLAMVMAGTGNLEVLKLCRHLRSRVGPTYNYVLYGSHMAISMAIGLLFMGGGRYTLSTSPESVAAMLCAFFPKFPIHSNDNRYHLQAFRHLYVLAVEPRLILPRDVDTGLACYVPLEVTFKESSDYRQQSYKIMAPGMLPELDRLLEVRIIGPRYWPIRFTLGKNWNTLKQILAGSGYLYVKQRAGHLSYAEDPKGYHSVLSQSLTKDQSLGKILKPEDIKSFSSDACSLAFAECFCHTHHEEEFCSQQFLSRVLYECVSQEKPEALATHIAMQQVVEQLVATSQPLAVWQLKLMLAFYRRQHSLLQQSRMTRKPTRSATCMETNVDNNRLEVDGAGEPAEEPSGVSNDRQLISEAFLMTTTNRIQQWLLKWQKCNGDVLVSYLQTGEMSSMSFTPLACYLTWYSLPHPSFFKSISCQGVPTFAELYSLLKSHGLSVSAVMALHSTMTQLASR